jgi:hypothetical protein
MNMGIFNRQRISARRDKFFTPFFLAWNSLDNNNQLNYYCQYWEYIIEFIQDFNFSFGIQYLHAFEH